MNARALFLLAASALALGSCSASITTPDCATRFAEIAQRFSAITSTIDASYVFDGGDRGANPEFRKSFAAVGLAIGDGRDAVADFQRREFNGRPSILIADGKTFIGAGAKATSSAAAVKQGCALEPRYGTLQTIRLKILNPTVRASATTTSTKNER